MQTYFPPIVNLAYHITNGTLSAFGSKAGSLSQLYYQGDLCHSTSIAKKGSFGIVKLIATGRRMITGILSNA